MDRIDRTQSQSMLAQRLPTEPYPARARSPKTFGTATCANIGDMSLKTVSRRENFARHLLS